ncbi:hypothetical protein Dimus_010776, partial [Dionaea muscipula]
MSSLPFCMKKFVECYSSQGSIFAVMGRWLMEEKSWSSLLNMVPMLRESCASNFPKNAIDYGLIVPNGSYAITASHCIQCSCGVGSS